MFFYMLGYYMKRMYVEAMAKELSNGIFWVIDSKLVAYPFYEDSYIGVDKSGNTFNHKKLWKELSISNSKPYNYYPRGRVDITINGKVTIYINSNINTEDIISKIKVAFGIVGNNYRVFPDNSDHYKCYLDEGWKADNSR